MLKYFAREEGRVSVGNILGLVVILFLFFGALWDPIMSGVEKSRADDATETFLVITGAGATAANVTLGYDLYQAKTAKVSSIVSTNGTDTPVAHAYYEDDKHLEIAGLHAGIARNITVVYKAETENTAWRLIGPWLAVGIVCFVLWLLYDSFIKNKNGR